MSTLLVTGGAGFIGSAFTRMACARGHRAVVLDALTYAGSPANLEGIPPAQHKLVVGNINNGALVAELLRENGVQAVLNFAAESHVDNSIGGPLPFVETNINGTFHLLQACLDYWRGLPGGNAFRYVQISTDEVYGSLGAQGYFTEETPAQPNSPYSASKAAADHLVRAWHHTYGLPTLITRCSNNYGPRQFPEKLIPHMIGCALAGKPLPVYGDGANVRDWIHVEDHCAGILLALERGTPGEVYNFGGRAEMRNLELVKLICALLDAKRPRADGASYARQITFVTDRPGHDRRYAVDDSKAERTLGFTRTYDFERGLAATVDWYLNNKDIA